MDGCALRHCLHWLHCRVPHRSHSSIRPPARAPAPRAPRRGAVPHQVEAGHAWQTICHPQSAQRAKLWQQRGAESRPSRENKVLLRVAGVPPCRAPWSYCLAQLSAAVLRSEVRRAGPAGAAGSARQGSVWWPFTGKSPPPQSLQPLQRLNASGTESLNDLESTSVDSTASATIVRKPDSRQPTD